jgi:hypothetical protein
MYIIQVYTVCNFFNSHSCGHPCEDLRQPWYLSTLQSHSPSHTGTFSDSQFVNLFGNSCDPQEQISLPVSGPQLCLQNIRSD